jgi:hypothetical protein
VFAVNDPLVEYTEPINSRIFKKADRLTKAKQTEFRRLRSKYLPLAMLFLPLHPAYPRTEPVTIELPLRDRWIGIKDPPRVSVSESVLNAKSLRDLLMAYSTDVNAATAEFDAVFGERA